MKKNGIIGPTKGDGKAKWFERERQNNFYKEMLLIRKMFWSIA